MADITREEIEAKVAASEARADTQYAIFIGKLDQMNAKIDIRFAQMEEFFRTTNQAILSLKITTIVTGISNTIAIILGVASFNATLQSNMIAAYGAGKDLATAQAEIKRQVEETAVLLRQLQEQAPKK